MFKKIAKRIIPLIVSLLLVFTDLVSCVFQPMVVHADVTILGGELAGLMSLLETAALGYGASFQSRSDLSKATITFNDIYNFGRTGTNVNYFNSLEEAQAYADNNPGLGLTAEQLYSMTMAEVNDANTALNLKKTGDSLADFTHAVVTGVNELEDQKAIARKFIWYKSKEYISNLMSHTGSTFRPEKYLQDKGFSSELRFDNMTFSKALLGGANLYLSNGYCFENITALGITAIVSFQAAAGACGNTTHKSDFYYCYGDPAYVVYSDGAITFYDKDLKVDKYMRSPAYVCQDPDTGNYRFQRSSLENCTSCNRTLRHAPFSGPYYYNLTDPLEGSFARNFTCPVFDSVETMTSYAIAMQNAQDISTLIGDPSAAVDVANPVVSDELIADKVGQRIADEVAAGNTITQDLLNDIAKDVITTSDLNKALDGTNTTIETGLAGVVEAVLSIPEKIFELFNTLWDKLFSLLQTIVVGVQAIAASVGLDVPIAEVIEAIHAIPGNIADALTGAISFPMPKDIADALAGVISFPLPKDIADALAGVISFPLPKDIADALAGVISFPKAQDIADALSGVITFPDVVGKIQELIDAFANFWVIDLEAVGVALADLKSTFSGKFPLITTVVDTISALQFSPEYSYPTISMQTPKIIRPYYDADTIILIRFQDYATQFSWVRGIVRASLWFTFIWHIIRMFQVKIRIS